MIAAAVAAAAVAAAAAAAVAVAAATVTVRHHATVTVYRSCHQLKNVFLKFFPFFPTCPIVC